MKKILPYLNVFAFLSVVFVNYYANTAKINNRSTGEVSDLVANTFTPAGYTFSIWGIIYILLAVFIWRQFNTIVKESKQLDQLGLLFILSCILNISWLISWHYEAFLVSVILMLGLLSCLILIYQRLRIGKHLVHPVIKYGIHLPFSIYLGWISVATIANIAAYLSYINWTAFGIAGEIWSAIMLVIAAILGVFMVIKRHDWTYIAVIIWATLGIFNKQYGQHDSLNVVCIIAIASMITCTIFTFLFLKKTYRTAK